jgi:UDP-N-acetylmuramoyl-tripeptide--D-alanyl-D-alanine ligase
MKSFLGRIVIEYLRFFAKIKLAIIKPDIIGITGSVGKTSTRDAIYLVLSTKYKCKKTVKANSESGIPLDILNLEIHNYTISEWLKLIILAPIKAFSPSQKYEKYIVEMGIDFPTEPKNMTYLLKILRPRTGVFTNVSAVHSQNFGANISETNPQLRNELIIKEIAKEKGKLITTLPANGWAVINTDDKNVSEISKNTIAQKITVGSKDADITVSNVQISEQGFKCEFIYKNKVFPLHIKSEILGEQYALNFALAIGVGIAHGISVQDTIKALSNYSTEPGRLKLLEGINGSHIIDSTYNSSFDSCRNALDVLDRVGYKMHKIAVLGDIRELGNEAEIEHKKVIEKTCEIAAEIYLIGPLMHKFAYPHALELGFNKANIHLVENAQVCGNLLKNSIGKSDIILVKASQNTLFLEKTVEILLSKDLNPNNVLCRRGAFWDNERSKTFNK